MVKVEAAFGSSLAHFDLTFSILFELRMPPKSLFRNQGAIGVAAAIINLFPLCQSWRALKSFTQS